MKSLKYAILALLFSAAALAQTVAPQNQVTVPQSQGAPTVNIGTGGAGSATSPLTSASASGIFSVTPTVQAAAYANGNVIGGLQTIATGLGPNGTATLTDVIIDLKSTQTQEIDVLIFNANPSNSTFTDKAALAVNTADAFKTFAPIQVTQYVSLGTPTAMFANAISTTIQADSSGNIYVLPVARGAITFASTSDVQITLKAVK